MIIQRRGRQLLAISQPDHAHLAGTFAERWRSLPGPSLVAAAHHHDDGWIAWERAPTVDAEGRPHDFLTIPAPARMAIYQEGIDLLAPTDLCAGLLTSLHFARLLAAGLGPLSDEARRLATAFLTAQEAWQAEARRQIGREDADVEADYQALRTDDYLSLLLCMHAPDQLDGASVGGMTLRAHGTSVTLEPYPFEIDQLTVAVPARVLPATAFDGDDAYRAALAWAPVEELAFTLSRPRS